MVQHFGYLFGDERDRPGEDVHEIRQQIRMLVLQKLLNIKSIVFEFDDGTLVIVEITVIGRREDSDDGGELLLSAPVVHLEAVSLGLMGSDDGKKSIFL